VLHANSSADSVVTPASAYACTWSWICAVEPTRFRAANPSCWPLSVDPDSDRMCWCSWVVSNRAIASASEEPIATDSCGATSKSAGSSRPIASASRRMSASPAATSAGLSTAGSQPVPYRAARCFDPTALPPDRIGSGACTGFG
jgi:hypothetical protein